MPFNWTCPYCNRDQTVTRLNNATNRHAIETVQSDEGYLGLISHTTVCSNPDCMKATISASIVETTILDDGQLRYSFKKNPRVIKTQRILPQSSARPQPDCIPAPLREDYTEACLIRDLSPKASATLSRRCLQGMIRDFCGVDKPNLFQDISALKKLINEGNALKGVSQDSVDAIDAVRKIGNIGAQMKKEVGVIIDAAPEEAQVLIDLIESLFEEWYIEREKRQKRFAKITKIAGEKSNQKLLVKSAPQQAPRD